MGGQIVLIFCVSFIAAVLGSHMQGGTISFRAREKLSNGWMVDFKYKSSFINEYHEYLYWYCFDGYCGNEIQHSITHIENTTLYPSSWYQDEGYVKRHINSDKPFQLWATSCCWVYNIQYASGWNLLTAVDLGIRSDTKTPNTSPVTTIIPIIRIPQNCATSIKLLAHDPDGDLVTCRNGYKYAECGLCTWNFPIDESNCFISVPSGKTPGLYVMELVLEDFPNEDIYLTYNDGTVSYRFRHHQHMAYGVTGTSEPASDFYTTEEITVISDFEQKTELPYNMEPLSGIPLQFLVEVTNSAPSCTFGQYRPEFFAPTPSHGAKLVAQVDKTFQLHLLAHAAYQRITDFKVSGPAGMAKLLLVRPDSNTTTITVEWTPEKDNVGEHVPVCFVAETASGFQSELRCVTIVVEPWKIDILCHENTMTIIVLKSWDNALSHNQFRLNDPACLVSSNSTHLIASVGYNSCGTETEETEENIVFKNEIASYDDISVVITRQDGVSIPFNCSFPKKNRVSASFHAERKVYVYTEAGFGNFTYGFQFFTDNQFVNLRQNPLKVQLKELLYMEIQALSSVPNIQLFVESCRATSHDNPSDPIFYSIIQNGCIKDDTLVVYPGPRNTQRFSMEAFAFIGDYKEVYISCAVILCKAEASNTRCTQGCITSPSGLHRRRRSLVSESQQHFISQGPIQMKDETPYKAGVEKSSAVDVNTLVIALSVMATVALISVTLNIYMRRTGTADYKRLNTQEF